MVAYLPCPPSQVGNRYAQYTSMHGAYHTIPSLCKGVVAGVCYKRSGDDGASWSDLTMVASGATQPTVVCDQQQAMTLILQFNVSIKQ